MEENRSHIIQVAIQCEQAPPGLVVPNLDLVIVTSGHKQGLGWVEVNTANWTIVFFKSVDKSSHAVVP